MNNDEASKIIRLFKLIEMLRHGASAKDISKRWECSERTVYRYFDILKSLGFTIELNNRIYRIPISSLGYIQFTVSELEKISALAGALPGSDAMRDSILNKTQILNGKSVSSDYLNLRLSVNIDQCFEAIQDNKQIKLAPYHSASGDMISDRIVEPKSISEDFIFLNAVDVADKKLKVYKLNRIGSVEILKTNQKIESALADIRDVFGMTGKEETVVSFSMNLRSKLLLEEEFPLSKTWIKKKGNAFVFEGPVKDYKGVARFVLGLLDEVTVLEPRKFKSYLSDKLKNKGF